MVRPLRSTSATASCCRNTVAGLEPSPAASPSLYPAPHTGIPRRIFTKPPRRRGPAAASLLCRPQASKALHREVRTLFGFWPFHFRHASASVPDAGDPMPPSPSRCMPESCFCPPERPDVLTAARSPFQAKLRSKTSPRRPTLPTPVSRSRAAARLVAGGRASLTPRAERVWTDGSRSNGGGLIGLKSKKPSTGQRLQVLQKSP